MFLIKKKKFKLGIAPILSNILAHGDQT